MVESNGRKHTIQPKPWHYQRDLVCRQTNCLSAASATGIFGSFLTRVPHRISQLKNA